VEEARHTVAEAHKDIRESLDHLSVEQGLKPLLPTLREYVTDFGQRNGIQAQFEAPTGLPHLSPVAQWQVLRIAQETLTNVRKHARATSVCVRLVNSPTGVELAVKDNGRGFDPAGPTNGNGQTHRGLKVMQERAQMLGGSLTVTSTPGQGTEVRAVLPVKRGGL